MGADLAIAISRFALYRRQFGKCDAGKDGMSKGLLVYYPNISLVPGCELCHIGVMTQLHSFDADTAALEMPTPPMPAEEALPAEETPAALVKPRRKPEPAWKRYDHLIHDGPAYFEALRKDRLAQARAERQEKVRQAALALFAARGVAQTSLARIAWHMEISPASLRRAYPDKAALLAGILEAHIGALLEVVGTAQEEADAASFAPRAKLSAMAAAALRYLAGEGVLTVRIAPQAEALLEPLSRAALAEKRRWLVALFASAIEEALPGLGARGGEPPARALLALLEAAASWSAADRGGEDLAAYAARAVAGVLAMANPPPEDGNGKPEKTEEAAETSPAPVGASPSESASAPVSAPAAAPANAAAHVGAPRPESPGTAASEPLPSPPSPPPRPAAPQSPAAGPVPNPATSRSCAGPPRPPPQSACPRQWQSAREAALLSA